MFAAHNPNTMNMNNMTRFLSKREKDGILHKGDKSRDKSGERKIRPSSSETLLPNFLRSESPKKTVDKEAQTQIAAIKLRLAHFGYHKVDDDQIIYVLKSKHAAGDLDKAVELLILFQQAVDGVIRPYDPKIVIKGSENREAVTCYLDSVLFAMFARLTSFEPILHNTFEDEPRRRLATLIRLWVNMLRSGLLIHTDITELIQEALKDCGWEEAALIEQQDTSEAFSFITETLQLPLLTLKMDIYHTGKEDDKDDHKLIQERLLEVAVPDETPSSAGISLENCLENYFNNRVEVRRHLERSNTLSSIRSGKQLEEKDSAQHVEVTELAWSSPNTPIGDSPSTPLPIRPGNRLRADSIIRQRVVEEKPTESEEGGSDGIARSTSLRKSALRKEVLMPAWQFFNLLPWYNRTQPAMNDADVASHFANARPVLGICLKRYGWREDYTPFRKDTFIDIPTDTKVPHFIEDDAANGDGPLFGNFKLSLQSVICHRGVSVNAGHYISFIRAKSEVSAGDCESDLTLNDTDGPPTYSPERWLRHDDMTYPRVVEILDIKKALKQEMPYLLFYQVLPMHDVSPPRGPEPPAYADSGVAIKREDDSPEPSAQPSPPPRASYFEGAATPAIRLSGEIEREIDSRQGLMIDDEPRRGSVAGTEGTLSTVPSTVASNFGAISAPATPMEETTAQRMSRAAQRFTRSGNKSRPTSSSGENRLSSSITRTMNLMKNTNLNRADSSKSDTVAPEAVFPESRRGSIQFTDPPSSARPSFEDNASRPTGESKLGRVRSKRGRGRDKGKEPSEGEARGHRHSRSINRLGKGKDSDGPDRECMIM